MKITLIIIGIIAVILIAIRIYLPFYIENKINKNIAQMEGYSGGVENVSLSLIAGIVSLSDINLYNENYPDPSRPFISLARNEISFSWTELFSKRLVGEISLDSLVINYVLQKEIEEVEEEADIVNQLKGLMDFQVDLKITNGLINFADITNDPIIEFSLTDFSATVNDLTNDIVASDSLPASIHISSSVMGSGNIDAELRVNYMKEIPDFDFELEMEKVDITDFNYLIEAYGGFEASNGLISVYTEAAANDGLLIGYIKPLIDELEITPADDEKLFRKFYESVLSVTSTILESPEKDLLATQVDFEGRIDDPEVGVWQSVWDLLKNGFVEGFSKGLTQEVNFEQLTD